MILVQRKQCVRLRSTKFCQVFEVGILDRHVEIAPADIVDEDVDRAGLREHAVAEVLADGRIGNIGGKGPGLAPALPHLVGGFCKRLRIARVQHDVGAGLGRGKRDHPPEAAAAAGDEQALAVQPESIEHVHDFETSGARVANA